MWLLLPNTWRTEDAGPGREDCFLLLAGWKLEPDSQLLLKGIKSKSLNLKDCIKVVIKSRSLKGSLRICYYYLILVILAAHTLARWALSSGGDEWESLPPHCLTPILLIQCELCEPLGQSHWLMMMFLFLSINNKIIYMRPLPIK